MTAEPPPTARSRRPRGSLSRREILDAACALTEKDGLSRLSMPALARRLGCAAMSIYRYFDSKDDLLAALAEQVMRDLDRRLPPAGEGPWKDELVGYFTAYRDLMDDLPVYREVVLYAPTFVLRAALTPAQLRRLDTGVGLMQRAGLTLDDAARVYNVCFNYTRSHVAFEQAVRAAGNDGRADATTTPAHPAADYPRLSRLPGIDTVLGIDEHGFRLGLELLAAGIARRYRLAESLS